MANRETSTRYSHEFKAKVVLQTLTAASTDTCIASAYGIHPVTLSRWKNEFLRNAGAVFASGEAIENRDHQIQHLQEALTAQHRELSLLQTIIEETLDTDQKVALVSQYREEFGLNRICEILQLPKSTYYYRMSQDEAD